MRGADFDRLFPISQFHQNLAHSVVQRSVIYKKNPFLSLYNNIDVNEKVVRIVGS